MIKRVRFLLKQECAYAKEVKEYMDKNWTKVFNLLCYWDMAGHLISDYDLAIVSDKDFPKYPSKKESQPLNQFLCFLQEVGFFFECNKNGFIQFNDAESYNQIVKNHLKLTGSEILDNLADNCMNSHGRISYIGMRQIIGVHYPKAPYLKNADSKYHTILFLKHVGVLYKFDDTHIYFP